MFIKQLELDEDSPILGVNPLTLAIALVVITIIIAAALSFWASGIGNKNTEKETDCSIARFKLYSGTYDLSKSSIFLILENLLNLFILQNYSRHYFTHLPYKMRMFKFFRINFGIDFL